MKELAYSAQKMGFKSINDNIKLDYTNIYKGYKYKIKRLSTLNVEKYKDIDAKKDNELSLHGSENYFRTMLMDGYTARAWYTGYILFDENDQFTNEDEEKQEDVLQFHGGITYSEESEDGKSFVLGFDCSHVNDFTSLISTKEEFIKEINDSTNSVVDVPITKIWSFDDVEQEIKESIDRLIEYKENNKN